MVEPELEPEVAFGASGVALAHRPGRLGAEETAAVREVHLPEPHEVVEASSNGVRPT